MKFDDKNFLAKQIKIHRKKMGLTQSELAEMVDLSDQHISRIENGQYTPSLKSFFMLVEVLKIDLALFGFNLQKSDNKRKNKLIEIISSASNMELLFYENLMEGLSNSFEKMKKYPFI